MTRTDMQRVRALTNEEALELHSLISENRNVNEVPFARSLKDSYICNGNQARLERCMRTESHYAATGGSHLAAKELGAKLKRRVTAGDGRKSEGGRVRDTHQDDADIGWIPFDEQYPNTGEQFSGELEIECRCHDEFSFKESLEEEGE
jgi:hypothetical protein